MIIKKYKIFALFCFFLFGNACTTQQKMSEEWKTYISNEVVQIHCPGRGVKDSDGLEYFCMYVGKVYEDALTYVSEDFKFADGFVGRYYIGYNVKMDRGRNRNTSREHMHFHGIVEGTHS